MSQQDPSKTETATQKRRGKAREQGSVAKSQELSKVASLLGGSLAIYVLLGFLDENMREVFSIFLGGDYAMELNPGSVYAMFLMISKQLTVMLLPFLLIMAGLAYITLRLQVGKLWTLKVFQFKFDKMLNPMAGIKRMLIDPKTLFRLGKQCLQAAAIGYAPYIVLRDEFPNFMPLFYQTPDAIAAYLLSTGFKVVLYALVPMILIAVIDLWYTRWSYEDNLKMSKDEVKDERRQAEGDPEVRAKQRQKMMAVMQRRMLESVPKADVIITNPTHIACALQYDVKVAPAPLLVAKGLDHLAEKIKEIAREHHVPIRENKPLAQALYKSVEVGDIISEELYQAVATILAQLDKFKRVSK